MGNHYQIIIREFGITLLFAYVCLSTNSISLHFVLNSVIRCILLILNPNEFSQTYSDPWFGELKGGMYLSGVFAANTL